MKFKQDMSGQSTLEYMAVAVLVMVGILGMGPYVIRSVNAYFEGAREQAQDSFREEFRQAGLDSSEDTLDMGENCSCNWSSTYTCGDGLHCDSTIEMQSLVCTPASCKYEMDARGLSTQCYERTLLEQGRVDYHSAAGCFPLCTAAANYTGCPYTTAASPAPDAIYGTCGYRCCLAEEVAWPLRCGNGMSSSLDGHSLDGMQLMVRRCGPDLDEQYYWEPSSACNYNCDTRDSRSSWCDPVSYNVNLTSDTPVVYLDYGTDVCEQEALDQGCAAGDTECRQGVWRCMAECDANKYLVANADGTGCDCAAPYVEVMVGVCMQCYTIGLPLAGGRVVEAHGGCEGGKCSSNSPDILPQLCRDYGYEYGLSIKFATPVTDFIYYGKCETWCVEGTIGDGNCSWQGGNCDGSSYGAVTEIVCCNSLP